jgi:hypothetical protein
MSWGFLRGLVVSALILFACSEVQASAAGWLGILRSTDGTPISDARIYVKADSIEVNAATDAKGQFQFPALSAGEYTVSVDWKEQRAVAAEHLKLPLSESSVLTLSSDGVLVLRPSPNGIAGTGGEQLSSQRVSELPLNKRDFSQLLLLAAGTMTDTNGATNFTAQFAVNGQRGVEAVFALDGADTSDPELGGATFSNFNVDAVEEIQSNSGWLPADVGRGSAGFTNIITRSGASGFHGSVFEFVRNSAFDARNFFDRQSFSQPERIPPFRRNEFGFTNGGALWRNRTFYFIQYQGFRQVLSTTQVLPVPTAAERQGIDTTAFPGDTLLIPVDPRVAKLIDRYPLPNDPTGAYGARTYATSSKVGTNANQFSVRLDHKLNDKSQLFARFNFNNLRGPTTNPDQTAIDPSFGVQYIDHQRNGEVRYTRTVSPQLTWDAALSVTRSTPSFPTPNHTDPALDFSDGLYEAFNSTAGSVIASFGNLFQGQTNLTWVHGKHTFKAGAELRANRDSTYFGTTPNGAYTFGGGTSYAPFAIQSLSGQHNIAAGAALPDTLSALLTASPFTYVQAVAPAIFPQGSQIGVAAISRYDTNVYVEDTWKISSRVVLDYGLRYEVYTPITERAKRTSGLHLLSDGSQEYVINPQPGYKLDLSGFGPRLRVTFHANDKTQFSVGGAITTIPPNIWQDNLLTGSTPLVVYPQATAAPGHPVAFGQRILPSQLPGVYTPGGNNIYASGNTSAVPANTVMDIRRFEQGLAALTGSAQITPLNLASIAPYFGNAYMGTWTATVDRQAAGLDFNASYVGTAAVRLPAMDFPNGYSGASPQFSPYTQYGFGVENSLTDRSHSTYHALQTSVSGNLPRGGPGIQASYTFSKSLDDTSSVLGGFVAGSAGAASVAFPQNPFDTAAEKGPSSFDVKNAFSASVIQDLPLKRLPLLARAAKKITGGWQLLSISTLTSGLPFTVYSGVQQTGAGSIGADRPDQTGMPQLSTSRTVREDYFGQGANNASNFAIPIHVAGGTGPNQGLFGTLGRNTFRGPGFHNFDFALIKTTPILLKHSGAEAAVLQFRAEFFNLFNIVNFGLPSNILTGSGFGEINRTAGTSRQIQFSLKMIF